MLVQDFVSGQVCYFMRESRPDTMFCQVKSVISCESQDQIQCFVRSSLLFHARVKTRYNVLSGQVCYFMRESRPDTMFCQVKSVISCESQDQIQCFVRSSLLFHARVKTRYNVLSVQVCYFMRESRPDTMFCQVKSVISCESQDQIQCFVRSSLLFHARVKTRYNVLSGQVCYFMRESRPDTMFCQVKSVISCESQDQIQCFVRSSLLFHARVKTRYNVLSGQVCYFMRESRPDTMFCQVKSVISCESQDQIQCFVRSSLLFHARVKTRYNVLSGQVCYFMRESRPDTMFCQVKSVISCESQDQIQCFVRSSLLFHARVKTRYNVLSGQVCYFMGESRPDTMFCQVKSVISCESQDQIQCFVRSSLLFHARVKTRYNVLSGQVCYFMRESRPDTMFCQVKSVISCESQDQIQCFVRSSLLFHARVKTRYNVLSGQVCYFMRESRPDTMFCQVKSVISWESQDLIQCFVPPHYVCNMFI